MPSFPLWWSSTYTDMVNTIQLFHGLSLQPQLNATADSCADIYDSYLICFKWRDELQVLTLTSVSILSQILWEGSLAVP